MRILFVVPYVPNLIRVRPYQLIRALAARGHQVTVLTLWTNEEERADAEALKQHCHHVHAVHLPRWRSLWNCLRALPTPVPLQAVYCWHPDLKSKIQNAVLSLRRPEFIEGSKGPRSQFDVVHVEHLRGAHYGLATKNLQLATCNLQLPIVWDSVDCISYLFEQAAQNSRSPFGRLMTRLELNRTRHYEAWLLTQFDKVLVTSETDKQALQDLASRFTQYPIPNTQYPIRNTHPTSHITVLPNGVDLNYFAPTDEPREPATLVISGKMSYHANVTAALHLVHDVMPHVWAQRPDVQVCIVGKDPPREIRNFAIRNSQFAIRVSGTVPDLRPYLRRATVAVAPVPYGAGIQNKVLEAMACGTPVVTSPQAISALQVRPDHDLVVAEGTQAFARAVLALLDDPARRAQLSQAGRAYVEAHHNWDAVAACLEEIYKETVDTQHATGGHPRP